MSVGLRIFTLIVLTLVVSLLGLRYGAVDIDLHTIWNTLWSGNDENSQAKAILFSVRIPSVLASLAVGGSLSVAGLVMQTLFKNPLAGPSVLGLSSGSQLGAALVILLGVGGIGQVGAALVGCFVVLLILLSMAGRFRSIVSLLVFGLMLGFFVSALVSVLQFYSQDNNISQFIFWGMGSFSGVLGSDLMMLCSVSILSTLLLWLGSRPLDAYLLGEEQAYGLGINVKRWRSLFILAIGFIVGTCTAYCGPIAFVGLAVPHLARILMQQSAHRLLIPATYLCGCIIATSADILTDIGPLDRGLPLNAILSFIGAPVVLWLVVARNSIIRI